MLLAAALLSGQTNKYLWKAELDDDVKKIQPVLNGKYLFLSSDEYFWLFENATGKKVWSIEVDDYSEKAVHQTVNDTLFLVANEDTLICYNMVQNKKLWQRSYAGIEQDRFNGLKQLDTLLIISYTAMDLGISLNDGKEGWRTPVEYQRSLIEKGTVNSLLLDGARKYFVITEKEECLLLNADDGKKLLSIPQSEPNGDLVKTKRAWYYISPDQKLAAFIFDKHFIVVNIEANKLSAQIPVKVSDQYNPLMPTAAGCAVIAEDRIVHLNARTGKVSQILAKIGDLRNLFVVQTDSAAMMMVGLEDKLIGWNLDIGKMEWQTALKFQPANGFVHRFLAQDSNDVVVTYLDPSSDLKLFVMSVNAATGKINYRTLIAHCGESLPKRELPLPPVASVLGPLTPSFGFENIGFEYQVIQEYGQAVFVIRTSAEMMVPNTEKRGGEGLVRLDMKNGQVLSKNYLRIADGLSFDGGLTSLAKTMTAGGLILCPGNKNLTVLDAATGALRWMLIEQDLNGGYIFDMAMIDTVLYVRSGGFKQEFKYDKKKDKIARNTVWEEDDYVLLAVDTSSGKVLWKRQFEMDPGRVFPSYSIGRYAKGMSNLFISDDQFLYSISLDPMRKGMMTWKFEYSDSGIGTMEYDDLFQRSTRWSRENALTPEQEKEGFFPLLESSVAGESFTTSLFKIIHVEYDHQNDRLFLFGDDGLAAVNSSTGRMNWYYEWDYDTKSIQQQPVHLKDHLFYVMDGSGVVLNATKGTVIATTKVDAKSGVFIMPDRDSVIVVDGDEITGFVIP
jgi:outer membrane protein assembly factor BamB